MEYKSVETQTEKNRPKLIKIESYANITFNRYYFDTESKNILTIRNGKNGKISKQIKPTNQYGQKFRVFLRDSNNNPRIIDYKKMIQYCENLEQDL